MLLYEDFNDYPVESQAAIIQDRYLVCDKWNEDGREGPSTVGNKVKRRYEFETEQAYLDHLDDVFDELNGLINIPETTCNLGSEE